MTVFSRIAGFIQLARPGNLVLIAVAVVTGAVLSGGVEGLVAGEILTVVLAAAATVLIAAGANAMNDALDVDVDRHNRMDRPIPSGVVSREGAMALSLVATAVGLVAALAVSRRHFVLAVTFAALLALYNHRLKHVAVVGNLICSVAVAATLVFGGLTFGVNTTVVVAATFALLTMLAREIVKDLEDVVGDVSAGSRTLPVVAGSGWARAVALGVIFMIIATVPLPYIAFNFSTTYLTVAVVAAGLLLASAWILADPSQHDDTARYTRASLYLKASMVAGLTAILFARLPA